MYKAYVVQSESLDEEGTPIDMKGVQLLDEDDIREWLFGPSEKFGNPMGPGYLKTHPELDGSLIQVRLVDN